MAKSERWQDLTPGLYIDKPGSAIRNRTGDWRTYRPVTDNKKCIKCAICWLYCPDASRYKRKDGYYDTDLYHCKGCGICKDVCPTEAITMVLEEW